MANKTLFATREAALPKTDTVNEAGGIAYSLGPREALAQFAFTGTFAGTNYTSARTQLDQILEMADGCGDATYVAKVAIACWEQGFMKDMSAFLTAWVALNAPDLLPNVFRRVVVNGKQLRNFCQIVRSGALGQSSICTLPLAAGASIAVLTMGTTSSQQTAAGLAHSSETRFMSTPSR